MISEFLLNLLQTTFNALFAVIPVIPPLPALVTNGLAFFTGIVGDTVGLISNLYSPPFFTAIVVLLLAVINFDLIYKLVLWVYHKVRG